MEIYTIFMEVRLHIALHIRYMQFGREIGEKMISGK